MDDSISCITCNFDYILYTQVCRKRQLRGGLERKLILLICVGIVHTNLNNCIRKFRPECYIFRTI